MLFHIQTIIQLLGQREKNKCEWQASEADFSFVLLLLRRNPWLVDSSSGTAEWRREPELRKGKGCLFAIFVFNEKKIKNVASRQKYPTKSY